MRFKLKRIVSTLLFGLACSIITALHISSQNLPNDGDSFRQQRGNFKRIIVPDEDQKTLAKDPGLVPPSPGRHGEAARRDRHSLGVRLQREMAWAMDDSSSDSVNNSPQQQNSMQPNKVNSDTKADGRHSDPQSPLSVADSDGKFGGKMNSRSGRFPQEMRSKADRNGTGFIRASTEQTELSDIFIGVKTTGAYHRNRLQLIIDTWLPLALKQTYFFTDKDDPHYQQILGDHLINTRCPPQHSRQDLCCKVAIIYDTFLESGKRWFCHLDDDNYLNVHNLVKLLRGYSHQRDHYLGRASLAHPIAALDRDTGYKEVSFWFATGGAGFCISRSLALKMAPLASGGQFTSLCSRVRLPDDVSIGFVIDGLLHVPLTKLDVFNSHLQGLNRFEEHNLQHQVTLSYFISASRNNTITLNNGVYTTVEDPTRIRSLHCKLYPHQPNCS